MSAKRLVELDPKWVKRTGPTTLQTMGVPPDQADGIQFDCPACPSGHMVMVFWTPGAWAQHTWQRSGGPSFDTLTLNPSIDGTGGGGCLFHGWVRSGEVTW